MITGVPLGTLHWNQTPSKKNATTSTARWLWSSRPCFLPDDNPQAAAGTRCGRATRWPHPARFVRKWACLRDAVRGVCHRSPQTGLGRTEVNIWPLSPVPGIQFQTTWADRWEPLSSVTSPLDHTCEGGEAGRWVWLVTGKTDPWIKVLDPAAPPPGRGLEPEFCPWAREVILCVRGTDTPHPLQTLHSRVQRASRQVHRSLSWAGPRDGREALSRPKPYPTCLLCQPVPGCVFPMGL